jgi:TPR repeat protein
MRKFILSLAFCTLLQVTPAAAQTVATRLGNEVKGQLTKADAIISYNKYGRCYRIEGVKNRTIEIYFQGGRELELVRFESGDCTGPAISTGMPVRPQSNQMSVLLKDAVSSSGYFVFKASEIPTTVRAGQPFDGVVTATDIPTQEGGRRHDCYVIDATASQIIETRVTATDSDSHGLIYKGETCEGDEIGFMTEAPANTQARRATTPDAGRYSVQIHPGRRLFARYQLTLNTDAMLTPLALLTEAPSLAEAMSAIDRGECARGLGALKLRENRFQEGAPMFVRAQLAETGACGVKDINEARRLYIAASRRGSDRARFKAALFLLEGVGGPKDPVLARTMLQYTDYITEAKVLLAQLQRDGIGGPVDLERARNNYGYAADQGWVGAAAALAIIGLSKETGEDERQRALLLLAEAATADDPDALEQLRGLAANEPAARYHLGATLASSTDSARVGEGRELLRSAKSAGVAQAGLALAASLAQGSSSDRSEAAKLYAEAASDPKLKYLASYLRAELRLSGRKRLPTARRSSQACPDPYDWEVLQRSYARWGLTKQDACQSREVQAETARAADKLHMLAVAALARDPLAAGLLSAELGRRCEQGTTVALAACAAWANAISLQRARLFSQNNTITAFYPWYPESDGFRRSLDIARGFDPQTGQAPDAELALYFYGAATTRGPDLLQATAHQRAYELYANGIGVPRNTQLASYHLEKAASLGGPQALYKKALDALAAAKSKEDTQYAANGLRDAANAGVVDAAFRYASMLERGEASSRKGWADIGTYYEMGAQSGHVPSMIGVAKAHANGWGGLVDMDKAEAWYVRAARAGNAEGAWRVAVMYSQRADHRGSIPWLKKAAKGGWPGASDTLSRLEAKGIRERSLGGFLLGAFDLIGEVGTGMVELHVASLEAERLRQEQMIVMGYLPGSGTGDTSANGTVSGSSSDGTVGVGGSVDGGGEGGSDSSGQGGRTSDAGSGGSYDESAGGSGDWGGNNETDSSTSRSSGLGGSFSGEGRDRNVEASNLNGGGNSKGSDNYSEVGIDSGGSQGAIIVSDGAAERAALEAKQAILKAEQDARTAQRLADEQAVSAKYEREWEARRLKNEERRTQALIRCHGSLEAAARATVSCQ